ncbi:hypothetical protein HN51_014921 [Arachis hypogaea]
MNVERRQHPPAEEKSSAIKSGWWLGAAVEKGLGLGSPLSKRNRGRMVVVASKRVWGWILLQRSNFREEERGGMMVCSSPKQLRSDQSVEYRL